MGKKCQHCGKTLKKDTPTDLCTSCANEKWKLEKQMAKQKKQHRSDLILSMAIVAVCSIGGIIGYFNNSLSFTALSGLIAVGAVGYVGIKNSRNKAS